MRAVLGLLALVIAVGIVLVLAARKTKSDFQAAGRTIPSLSEGVAAIPFDADEANRMAARLESLLAADDLPQAELHNAAMRAAGWVAACQPGTPSHHAAVALRGAAVELAAASSNLDDPHRQRARGLLSDCRAGLAGIPAPGGPTSGLRDQLKNLEYSQRQRYQETDRQLQ